MSARAPFVLGLATLLFLSAPLRAAEPLVPSPIAAISVQGGATSFPIPANDGWVTDLAHLLTPTEERELEASLGAFQRASGHDIALLTVPNLGGRTIEEYALAVARGWKIGSPERNDGALLVVAKEDRKLRIEVGDGLEGTLTDARCARIIRDTITPRFKAGQFGAGLRAGIEEMQRAANGDAAPAPVRHNTAPPVPAPVGVGGLFCGLLFLVFFVSILVRIARRASGFGHPRRGWGSWARTGSFLGSSGLGGFSGGGFSSGGGGGGGFGGFSGGGRFSGGGSSGGW